MHLIAKNVLVMRYGYIDENNVLLYGRHFYNAADEFLFVRLRRLLQQAYIYISHYFGVLYARFCTHSTQIILQFLLVSLAFWRFF